MTYAPSPYRFHPSILREYDVRGIVGETLSTDDAYHLGLAYAALHRQRLQKPDATVAVCRDGRLSSPALADALCAGLTHGGLHVITLGVGPTPLLYFSVFQQNLDGGIMVTGSHNPPQHNGFKLMLGKKALFGSDIAELGRIAAASPAASHLSTGNIPSGHLPTGTHPTGIFPAGHSPADTHPTAPLPTGHLPTGTSPTDNPPTGTHPSGTHPTGTIRTLDLLPTYIDSLLDAYDGTTPLHAVWDAGNGAAGEVMAALCARLPGQHTALNAEIDGTFPAHHPDPSVAENLQQLITAVTTSGAAVGLAFDGDGDRVGIVDGRGHILWGDQIMALLAEDVLRHHPGATVIADVKASQMLFDHITRHGGTPLMWKTGHSLVKAKMAEIGAPLAGEMSGHLFFADRYYGFDDGLYAAVRVLGILSRMEQSLAEWLDSLPVWHNTPEIRFACDETRKFAIIEEVKIWLQQQQADVVAVDGVRVNTPDGWWLLRASNTQAVLGARAESHSAEGLERLVAQLRAALAASGVELPAPTEA